MHMAAQANTIFDVGRSSEQPMPMTRAHISVRFSVIGYHRWPDPPPQYAYLRHLHRHEFVFQVAMDQPGSRVLEINAVAAMLKAWVVGGFPEITMYDDHDARNFGTLSCEDLAQGLLEWIWGAYAPAWAKVTVLEDGKQGAGREYSV